MKSVLFILQLPPPKHGASFVGDIIRNSKKINNFFSCDYIRISTIPSNGKRGLIHKILSYIRIFSSIKYRFRTKKYDLVYMTPCASGMAFFKDFFICFFVKFFNKNIVYHFHNKGISTNRMVHSIIKREFFKNVKIILLSPLLYDDIKKYVEEDNVYYCPNGISECDSINEKFNNDVEGRVSILYLSNMIKSKGVYILLETCKMLKDKNVNFLCKFIGPWYEIKENAFYSKVDEYNLENHVKYLGPKYGRDKYSELRNSDIFTFPSFYPDECFPLVLLEAMSCKLPIVTTNEGAISEIIENEKQGFIISKNNPKELTAALEILIENEDLRNQMGRAGFKKFKEKYTIDTFENRFIDLINSI